MDLQGHRVSWWTGGTDIGWEGNWTWANSRQPVGDFVWASGQPNYGTKGNCLCLLYSIYEGYDDYCAISQNYPICQLNI